MKFFTFSIESSGFSVLDLETRKKQINVLVSHACHLCFDPVNPSESINNNHYNNTSFTLYHSC